jgi:hypothetical protein
MTGLPYLIRVVVPTLGLRRPKVPVRGMDLAGNVEAVGSTVTRFQPGDEVFGRTDGGSYAEYACAPEDYFARNYRTSPLRRRRPCPSPASPPSRRCGMWARVTFNAHIIETGTQSYRLATSKTSSRKRAS